MLQESGQLAVWKGRRTDCKRRVLGSHQVQSPVVKSPTTCLSDDLQTSKIQVLDLLMLFWQKPIASRKWSSRNAEIINAATLNRISLDWHSGSLSLGYLLHVLLCSKNCRYEASNHIEDVTFRAYFSSTPSTFKAERVKKKPDKQPLPCKGC